MLIDDARVLVGELEGELEGALEGELEGELEGYNAQSGWQMYVTASMRKLCMCALQGAGAFRRWNLQIG